MLQTSQSSQSSKSLAGALQSSPEPPTPLRSPPEPPRAPPSAPKSPGAPPELPQSSPESPRAAQSSPEAPRASTELPRVTQSPQELPTTMSHSNEGGPPRKPDGARLPRLPQRAHTIQAQTSSRAAAIQMNTCIKWEALFSHIRLGFRGIILHSTEWLRLLVLVRESVGAVCRLTQ